MSAATLLPEPTPPAWDLNVYVSIDTHGERFIAVSGTLSEAQKAAEDDPEAIPYFGKGMTWAEAAPLPPLHGHTHGRRQWVGEVVTEPYASPREFRIIEQRVQNVIGL